MSCLGGYHLAGVGWCSMEGFCSLGLWRGFELILYRYALLLRRVWVCTCVWECVTAITQVCCHNIWHMCVLKRWAGVGWRGSLAI
jgi:hypothetical protein